MQRNATEKAALGERLAVTPKQSMKISGLSQRMTYNSLKTGELPAIWNGKGFLIPLAALHEFLLKWAKEESARLADRNRMAKQPLVGSPRR
jgi:hypothetical protein